jgi:hypothetical protein
MRHSSACRVSQAPPLAESAIKVYHIDRHACKYYLVDLVDPGGRFVRASVGRSAGEVRNLEGKGCRALRVSALARQHGNCEISELAPDCAPHY